MIKTLLLVLSFLLWIYIWSPTVHAESVTGEMTLDINEAGENEFDGLLSLRLVADTQKALFTSTKLVISESFVSGFVSATTDGKTLDCQKSGEYVECDLSGSGQWNEIIYSFRWSPRNLIESAMCTSQYGRLLERKYSYPYIEEFEMKVDKDHPFVRKLKISKVTTAGNVKDLFADVVTDDSYVILWGTRSFEDGGELGSLEFVTDSTIPKLTGQQNNKSGAYRSYLGSLGDFHSSSDDFKNIKLTIIDTATHEISVSPIELQTCRVEDISTQSITAKPIHKFGFENGDLSIVEGRFLTANWTGVSYEEAEPTLTPTPPPTYTPTPTNTTTPTPTLMKVVSSNVTSTPTPIIQSSTPSATPIFTPTSVPENGESGNVASSSPGNRSASTFVDAIKNILGVASSPQETQSKDTGEASIKLGVEDGQEVSETVNNDSKMIIMVLIGIGVIMTIVTVWRRGLISPKNILRLMLIASLYCILPKSSYAQSQSPISYKITDAFTMKGTGTLGYVTNFKTFLVTRAEVPGKYVISRNPDGTGDITVGNYLQAIVQHTYWSSSRSHWVGPERVIYSDFYKCPDNTTIAPPNVSSWFHSPGTYSLMFRFITSCNKYFPVSDLYLVFIPDAPTPTPTITPTPTPTPFVPFLELPWDYRGKGLTFSSAATSMSSYFDHEYPLLSRSVVGVDDPPDDYMVIYSGTRDKFNYSSHDGYDFAKLASANYSDPQLAAASGEAELRKDYWQMGNAIFIDHGNRFQTRYYHLDDKDLLTTEYGKKITVKQGQMIGRIGHTGNVIPSGEGGAHIHFMVVYDKNNDGKYDDNIPDGLVDPFGWSGDVGADPWENAVFELPKGVAKSGMRSSYLWKHKIDDKKTVVGPTGGNIQGDGYAIDIGAMELTEGESLEFRTSIVPRIKTIIESQKENAGITLEVTVKNQNGEYVRYFNNPFNIVIDLLDPERMKLFKPESLKIVSSSDGGETWQEEITTIDWNGMKAIATVNHTTHFMLVGEKIDNIAPQTTIALSGSGKSTNYRSDVIATLEAQDDPDSLGIEYTLYTLDDFDEEVAWKEYVAPIIIDSEGSHKIKAFSADKSGNLGEVSEISFTIDKTLPEVKIKYATESAKFSFESADESATSSESQLSNMDQFAVEDVAGNVHEIEYKIRDEDGLHLLIINKNILNGLVVQAEPWIYAISDADVNGYQAEFLTSGANETRIISSAIGEDLVVDGDGRSKYFGSRPLQLVTSGDKLIIIDSKN